MERVADHQASFRGGGPDRMPPLLRAQGAAALANVAGAAVAREGVVRTGSKLDASWAPRPAEPAELGSDLSMSVAAERYAVAMTFTTFLMIVAAALLSQGVVAGRGAEAYSLAGIGCILAGVGIMAEARSRLRAQCEREELGEGEARGRTRQDVEALRRLLDR